MTRKETLRWLDSLKKDIGQPQYRALWHYTEVLDIVIEALSAEVTQGEWVDEDGNKVPLDKDGYPLGSCWCNQCHEWLVGSDEYYTKGNFCPSCGVKMKNRG